MPAPVDGVQMKSVLYASLVFLLSLPATVSAQVWTLADSPHTVSARHHVESGEVLRIEAGVEVLFDAPGTIDVDGVLLVEGDPEAPVVFRSSGPEGTLWRGIEIGAGGRATIRNAEFRFADTAILTNGNVTLEDSEFVTGDDFLPLFCSGGSLTVNRVHFSGGWVTMGSFCDAAFSNIAILGGTIEVLSNGSAPRTYVFDHMTMQGSPRGLILASDNGSRVEIHNSIIANSLTYGTEIRTTGSIQLRNSLLWNNAMGEEASTDSTVHTGDPLFISATDLRLQSGSPAIDIGADRGFASDADNNPRPIDGDASGSADPDAGAFEHQPPADCGDGIVQLGEACDDGNEENTDACLNTCAAATCGDGFVQSGVEACDDGNEDNTDACLNTCAAATCGDGFVQRGIEACDDGNTMDGDGCSARCTDESVEMDAGVSDAGAMNADAGAMNADAGAMNADAGAMNADAGATNADAGAMNADAGAMTADAGAMNEDAGATNADAGAMNADAGPTTVDAGSGSVDGESGGCSAGAENAQGSVWLFAIGLAFVRRRRRR